MKFAFSVVHNMFLVSLCFLLPMRIMRSERKFAYLACFLGQRKINNQISETNYVNYKNYDHHEIKGLKTLLSESLEKYEKLWQSNRCNLQISITSIIHCVKMQQETTLKIRRSTRKPKKSRKLFNSTLDYRKASMEDVIDSTDDEEIRTFKNLKFCEISPIIESTKEPEKVHSNSIQKASKFVVNFFIEMTFLYLALVIYFVVKTFI